MSDPTKSDGFTDEERAAMKERARELKTAARRPRGAKADEEGAVRAKIAEMPASDRVLAETTPRGSTTAACGRPPTR
jgi:hypothetical protein